MTKAELIELREDSYQPPPMPETRCETCRHYWNYLKAKYGACHAIEVRGKLVQKQVHPLGVCALWEKGNDGTAA